MTDGVLVLDGVCEPVLERVCVGVTEEVPDRVCVGVWVEVTEGVCVLVRVGVILLVDVAESVALLLALIALDPDNVGAALLEGCVEADTVGAELTVGQPVVLAIGDTLTAGVHEGAVEVETDADCDSVETDEGVATAVLVGIRLADTEGVVEVDQLKSGDAERELLFEVEPLELLDGADETLRSEEELIEPLEVVETEALIDVIEDGVGHPVVLAELLCETEAVELGDEVALADPVEDPLEYELGDDEPVEDSETEDVEVDDHV